MIKNVLGVKIDDIPIADALQKVKEFLSDGKSHYIVTPNPEIIIEANKDKELLEVLKRADLSIPDGFGLKFAGIKNRFAGADFMEEIIKHSEDWAITIGLLGGDNGIAEKARECLEKRYQNISVVFAESGGIVDENGNSKNLKLPQLDILFVGFGHGKQEKWIYKNLNSQPVKVFMAVGGSLDYISGKVPRAPKILRALGFEWLFRLLVQPWRVKRQFSLVVFMIKLIFKRV